MTATPSSTKTDAGASATLAKRLRKCVIEIRSVDVQTDSDALALGNATGDILVIATTLDSSRNTDSGVTIDSFIEKVNGHPTDIWRTEEVTGILEDIKAELTKSTADTSSKAGESE